MERIFCAVVLCALALAPCSALAQTATLPPVAPGPARTPSGVGSPVDLGYACDKGVASTATSLLYFDTSPGSIGKRIWVCSTQDGSAFAWQNFPSNVAATVTPAISTTLGIVVATNTFTGTVSYSAAVSTMTIDPPVAIGADAGLVQTAAWVSAPGVISYRITNLAPTNTVLSGVRFALYLRNPT